MEATANSRVDLPDDVRKFLTDLAGHDSAGCAFWGCPGPDVEPVDMATCYHCRTVYDARQLLTRGESTLTPSPEEDPLVLAALARGEFGEGDG